MGIILITHDMGVIAGRADRVLVMYAGRKVETAETAGAVQERPPPLHRGAAGLDPAARPGPDPAALLDSGPSAGSAPAAAGLSLRAAVRVRDRAVPEPRIRRSVARTRAIRTPASTPGSSSAEEMGDARSVADRPGRAEQGPDRRRSARSSSCSRRAEEPAAPPPPIRTARPEFILEFRDVTKEFPVTAGAILRRKIGALHAVTERRAGGSGPARRSGSSASPAAARRRSAAWASASRPRPAVRCCSTASISARVKGGRACASCAGTCSSCSRTPTPRSTPHAGQGDHLRAARHRPAAARPKERDRDRARACSTRSGLAYDAMDRYPHEFSGGQRQRIGLARALALNPKVIVADEPVSALDVSIRSQILNLMKRLQATHGLTYIVISHDLSVVRYLADRIGVMYLGKLVEIGPGDDIYDAAGPPLHRRPARGDSGAEPRGRRERRTARWPSAASSRRRSTRRRAAASAPGARGRRTSAPRRCRSCARSGREHLAACHFPLQQPMNGSGDVLQTRRSRRPEQPPGSPSDS